MDVVAGRWIPLNVETIAALPHEAGVFEIATLVRNVVQIGCGEGDLQQAISALGGMPSHLPVRVGGYYVRYTLTEKEEEAREALLANHRRQHGGELPTGNQTAGRTLRLAARRAA